ncbi:MAG TPA: GNAT family N-acetyltransferase [Steroidobacteraceae bacterium]|nr:GNAT family N-acetyltransferase [Steroidobacteraceae bacterium]
MLKDLPLDAATHDREGFECGVPALDEYLRRYADQHRRRGITSVFVLADSVRPKHILGYYTLSAAEVDGERLAPADRKKLPGYPVPCFRMGRLACRLDQRGRGLGKLLVGCAVDRCLKARREVAAFALIVDAKDDAAAAFYMHFGFMRFVDAALTLYLPLGK